ncbi:protocatechuate 3,4-dioxygenase [Seminavis robusta]|uniref:Protocatechuate 3,4-dioxygenase n=1 Tax=Seminavis robusta TaxID=568900 RepID=A0A9N8EDI7_9STRA|nr:protocatechuate 3,4-dioxygenase [Seminavis robusta]|eukprot:Sro919_g220140.1 protocatechuate 3,4-dioxygenase (470) ;mRNA; f:32453-33961
MMLPKMSGCLRILFLLLVVFVDVAVSHGGSDKLARHLVIEDLSMVVVMADAEQTPGPFAEQDDDYVWTTNDLTAAGRAGAPGIGDQDRATVVNGIPMDMTVNVYNISDPTTGGTFMENIQVFLWHTDAAGVYSAADSEGTEGQVWCRGVQITDDRGQVRFRTILPGWYTGRAIHYHLRLRFMGATPFAATTQFYISDDDLEQYQTAEQYTNTQPVTPLAEDGIFNRLDAAVQDLLTLSMDGSVDTGFTTSISVGLLPAAYSQFQGDGAGSQNTRPDGDGPAGEGVELTFETTGPTTTTISTTTDEPTPVVTTEPTATPVTMEPTIATAVPTQVPTTTTTNTEEEAAPVSFTDAGDYPLSVPHGEDTPTASPPMGGGGAPRPTRPIVNNTLVAEGNSNITSPPVVPPQEEEEAEAEESSAEIATEEEEALVSRVDAEVSSVKSLATTSTRQHYLMLGARLLSTVALLVFY